MKWGGPYSRQPHGYWRDADILIVGERAGTLLLKMSDFADDQETDGIVTDLQVTTLGTKKRVKDDTAALSGQGLIARTATDDGWQIVDWLDGHKTAVQLAKLRTDRRDAGRKGGRRSRGGKSPPTEPDNEASAQALAQANAEASGEANPDGSLKPLPFTPLQTPNPPPPAPSPSLPSDGLPPPTTDELAAAVAVADEMLTRTGYPDQAADQDLVGYVGRALRRGWPAQDLLDAATEIGAMPPEQIKKTPLRVLLGAARKRANSDAPPELSTITEPEIDLGFDDVHAEYSARSGLET